MKWKLAIRKEVKAAAALVCLFVLIAFTERKQEGTVITNIVVDLENVEENHFMDEADVLKLVEVSGQSVRGVGIERVNLKEIEAKLKGDKHILDAELFGDLKGDLVVKVELRRPMARIVQEDAPDAYIAEDGVIVPVSDKFTSRVVLISGAYVTKLLELEDLNKSEEGRKLLDMVRLIHENSFWSAQVAQLDINAEGKVTIYPQVTGQLIQFGKPDDLEIKFRKLMIFYKEILPTKGWNRYHRVNLEYEGQIIAE